ncbi:carboxypeptidase-like regulatory domain-containing protein [Gramella sp. GC03-9]|uniref:Carboxypeptidase-like regulatory domain-containing protein n=1 Tax=Christiangramia oceanisediminis TaxID=2920386 RepID=A0A9X2R832_9FLAO|nr:carboxypeptidase-like regulatory domain-containing protein [Gramella oceanisediminis]MCP9200137.1 carboxypeptidase-like regulatory domain-containing protein [Gramella oceanisediminis]
MKQTLLLFFMLFTAMVSAQDVVTGTVMNAANDNPIENVHIVNLNQVKGAVTNEDGEFELQATVNDTLYFSYLGFRSIRVRVTNDWLKYGNVKVKMTELGFALEEVTVNTVNLTGYLEIDAKNIPIYENYRYSISGLNTGYEGGDTSPNAVTKAIRSLSNPADLVYNIFGNRPRQMKKLRQMKQDENIRNLLRNKFDRETLMALLQVNKAEINEILNNCNYSEDFMKSANDLQILDAISSCYEEYKVLQKN